MNVLRFSPPSGFIVGNIRFVVISDIAGRVTIYRREKFIFVTLFN